MSATSSCTAQVVPMRVTETKKLLHHHPTDNHNTHDALRTNTLGFVADFCSSWCSIAFSLLFSHPLDTLRIRRQTHLLTVRETISGHGLRSLYHGALTPLVTTGPSIANAFALNDLYKRLVAYTMHDDITATNRLRVHEVAMAGGMAGFTSSLVQCPLSVIRIQQQVASAHGHGVQSFTQTARDVYAHGGWRTFYRGLPSEAIQCGAGRLVYFTVYEEAKQFILPNVVDGLPGQVLSAIAASWCGWVAVYPFDVVKSRVQGDHLYDANLRRYRGIFDCAKCTYKELGLRGFWLGIGTTLARGCVSSGLSLPGYDYIRPILWEKMDLGSPTAKK